MSGGFTYTVRGHLGKNLLFRSFSGKLTADMEIDMLQYAIDKGLVTEKIRGMVLDMREADFNLKVTEIEQILDYVYNQKSLARLKFALIADTPQKVIQPLLGEMLNKQVKLKPFSTEEAAMHWVVT